MRIVTDKFVTISFVDSERKRAGAIVQRLKKAGYSVEVDDQLALKAGEFDAVEDISFHQLLNTFIREA